MNKSIAILIPTLRSGGAEKQAVLLAKVLDKHCIVNLYLLYNVDNNSPQNIALLSGSNVKIHSLSGNIFTKIAQLKTLLKHHKTDVIFNYLTSCNVVGAVAARIAGVKRIYGGIRNTRLEWWKMQLDKFVHNCLSSGTVYNCYSGAEYFTSKGFAVSKNIVISNCFINISDPIERVDRSVKHIVTVGRFVPQKDYRTLIRTIASLKLLRQDFVVDIIGYGEEEENIRSWVNEYNVEDLVNIYIRPDNVQDIVRDADIYLSTSLFEGTSNSIMEALNWSLPVVATYAGDNYLLAKNGVNGMLHDVGDYEGMAQSLAMLLDNEPMRNEYGVKGNKNLRECCSIEIFEERYLNLIKAHL